MNAILTVRNLSAALGGKDSPREILTGIDLDLDSGEALALVGESGSGKSTTAKAILRALPTTARVHGQVHILEQDVYAMGRRQLRSMRARDVALIGQNPSTIMNPLRTVGHYATEALRTNQKMKTAEAEGRLSQLLREVGITTPERVLGLYPHELSGGMLQRVVIATALVLEPRLIIADEPTSGLDVSTQAEVAGLLADLLQTHGTALLFITHDLDLAAAITDRTAVMYAGSIVEEQPSAEIVDRPRHPYTAGLGKARTRVDVDIERLTAIPGRPIAAFESAGGCPFAPRCMYAQSRCRSEVPPVTDTANGRVACWRSDEIRALLVTDTEFSANHEVDHD